MKKSLLLTLLATAAISANADTYVMDLREGDFTYEENGSWTKTYDTSDYEVINTVDTGIFSALCVSTYYGYAYNGFLPCIATNNEDKTDEGWVANQWGVMAGGAVKVDADGNVVVTNGTVEAEAGAPYLMGYFSEWTESDANHSNVIYLSTDAPKYAQEVYVCNSPYAYYTLLNGDSFSRAFTEADDQFTLYIHGLDENFEDNGKVVEYTLANTVEVEAGTYAANQSADWNRVDISALGQVNGFYFTMSSTDSGDYGMNTPAYFCLDRLAVSDAPSSAIEAVVADSDTQAIYYNLQGVRVANPTAGVYVKVCGTKASKVIIR